ncbi:MAG: NAD(P)H-hydrate dehydratase, partial [Chthoniobacterales bacterium]
LSPLAAQKLSELRAASQPRIENRKSKVVLDGLLGIGAEGSPREPVATAIQRIQSLRNDHNAFVVAADVPSGLNADTGEAGDPCVTADLTVTIGHCKTGLVADAATNFVGRLALVELPELATEEGDSASLITPAMLRPLLPPRPFDSHKGTFGRVGIVAGSPGFLGAAKLCAEAALHAGAGLVTLYASPEIYNQLAPAVSPEIMVMPVRDYLTALNHRLDAVGIGPGLGLGSQNADSIRELVTRLRCPATVDADALNLLARTPLAWQRMDGPRLFTPHPVEMARLFRESMDLQRRPTAEQYVSKHAITLLLKGARTIIAERKRPLLYNTTGNPGMGSGGMGDVLTGVCAALMGAKRTPREAAMLGAWLCGRAAELSVFAPGGSPESLTATDVIRNLGAAFRELRGTTG